MCYHWASQASPVVTHGGSGPSTHIVPLATQGGSASTTHITPITIHGGNDPATHTTPQKTLGGIGPSAMVPPQAPPAMQMHYAPANPTPIVAPSHINLGSNLPFMAHLNLPELARLTNEPIYH